MSEQQGPPGEPQARSAGRRASAGGPSEEELRAAYEAELSRITSAEMVLQAAVSLLNIGGYRLGARRRRGEESADARRDLEQVRDAIDGVRGLMPILERRMPGELRPLRDALSRLQMAYAREAGTRRRTGRRRRRARRAARPEASGRRRRDAGEQGGQARAGTGRVQRAGCGCRDAERPERPAQPFRRCRHDRLRARLRRIGACPCGERPSQARNVRAILARHANQTAED